MKPVPIDASPLAGEARRVVQDRVECRIFP
jgi:hypothetical protein